MTILQSSPFDQIVDGVVAGLRDLIAPLLLPALLVVAAGAVAILVLWLWRRRQGAPPRARIYRSVDSLLTPTEREFFGALIEATADEFHVFSKVRLIDVIQVRAGVTERQAHFNRIVAKHVDFVLCDRDRVAPVLVIELDDRTHLRRDRQERDEFVDRALEDAEIPILHVPVAARYDAREIREDIERLVRARASVGV